MTIAVRSTKTVFMSKMLSLKFSNTREKTKRLYTKLVIEPKQLTYFITRSH